MAEVVVTNSNFETEVLKSDIPVVVDFWATWCGPCRMLAPVLADIAERYEGKVKVAKVNVDEEPELAMKFNVVSIPMLLYFKDGEISSKLIGYAPKEEIEAMFVQKDKVTPHNKMRCAFILNIIVANFSQAGDS